VHVHVIPSVSTLMMVNSKNQAQLELDMYFDELIHMHMIISCGLITQIHDISYMIQDHYPVHVATRRQHLLLQNMPITIMNQTYE